MEMHPLSPPDDYAIYFKTFVKSLAERFEPLQIFSFAKTTSLEQKQGCFLNQEVKHNCDYWLLLVTESPTRIDYDVQDFANRYFQHGFITIICHCKESILEAIKANNRFFSTVYTSGKIIYSHDGLLDHDSTTPFNPVNAGTKALKHYDHRMPLAEGFLMGAGECLNNQRYSICVFMLHQVVEQICITLIRVHIAYRSEFHNLHRLLRLCSCFSDEPYKLFLSTTEDERLFDVLSKSYSGARYKDDFSVLPGDAVCLYDRVLAFVALAKEMCQRKIAELGHEAISYKELTGESEVVYE